MLTEPAATTTVPDQADNPFDDSHRVDLADTGNLPFWTCPKCHLQYKKTPERLMNLERTGRYFLECKSQLCGTSMIIQKRKDSAIGQSI
jgi:hypothetical protein